MEKEFSKEQISKSSLEYCFEQQTEIDLFYKWLFQQDQKNR